MKRFPVFVLAVMLFLASCATAHGQLVKFLNYNATTKIVNGSIYTVRYALDSALAKEALYLYINQHALGSRYQIPAFQCFMPPFPQCSPEFGLLISANDGMKINLVASSYLTQTRGIIDSSEYATVIPRTSSVDAVDTDSAQVFPNPAQTYVTLRIPPPSGAPLVVTMYSIDGQEIYRYISKIEIESVSFDTRMLPSGAYWLRVHSPNNLNTLKFIIEH